MWDEAYAQESYTLTVLTPHVLPPGEDPRAYVEANELVLIREYAAGFHEMGVDVFTRHIQAHTQGAWWPSKVAAIHPMAQDRNLAKEIIGNAHKAGCRVLVYHVHMYDRLLGEEHPDWVCRCSADPCASRVGPRSPRRRIRQC